MLLTKESKAQRYRAVAQFRDGTEGLIVLGSSASQIMELFGDAFLELYDAEQRSTLITGIQMQRWEGEPDSGRWKPTKTLNVPQPVHLKIAARNAADALPIRIATTPPFSKN